MPHSRPEYKTCPISDQNGQKHTLLRTKNGSQPIVFGAAHSYIACKHEVVPPESSFCLVQQVAFYSVTKVVTTPTDVCRNGLIFGIPAAINLRRIIIPSSN